MALNLYGLPRNNVKLAVQYVEEQWGKLRPEDFTILAKLQDNPKQMLDALAKLQQRMQREKRGKPTKTAEVDQLGELVSYRDVPYCAVQDQLDGGRVLIRHAGTYYRVVTAQEVVTKWVRAIRIRDGKVIQVKREVALANPHKYKPLRPLTTGQPDPTKHGPKPGAPPTTPLPKWVRVVRIKDGKIVQVKRDVALAKPHKYKLLTSYGVTPGKPQPPQKPTKPVAPPTKKPTKPQKPLKPPSWLAAAFTDSGRTAWRSVEQSPALRAYIDSAATPNQRNRRAHEAVAVVALHHLESTGKFLKVTTNWGSHSQGSWANNPHVAKLLSRFHDEAGTDKTRRAPREAVPKLSDSVAALRTAFQASWVPHTRTSDATHLEDSTWLQPTQPPPKMQQQIRQGLSNILALAGMYNHQQHDRSSTRYLVATQLNPSGGLFTTHGLHTWAGATYVREDVHRAAARFFIDPEHASDTEVDAAKVLLHEEVHGHSPMQASAYRGAGAFVEEATTELAARHVLESTFSQQVGRGTYQREIDRLTEAVGKTAGIDIDLVGDRSDLQGLLKLAAIKMREPQHRIFSSERSYVQHFSDTFARAIPDDHAIFQHVESKQRDRLRKKIAKELHTELISDRTTDYRLRGDLPGPPL